jgi:hypothetical protein
MTVGGGPDVLLWCHCQLCGGSTLRGIDMSSNIVIEVLFLLLVPSLVCGSFFLQGFLPCWVEGGIRVCAVTRGGCGALFSTELASMSFGCNALCSMWVTLLVLLVSV